MLHILNFISALVDGGYLLVNAQSFKKTNYHATFRVLRPRQLEKISSGKISQKERALQQSSLSVHWVNTRCISELYRPTQQICPQALRQLQRGGGLGSRPQKVYRERLGDGVEYHLMSPTPRR